jgi:hypothetical protein
VHCARWKGGRLVEGDSGHGDDRGGSWVAIERSPAGLAVGLRHGIVGARSGIGDPRAGLARRRDHDDRALVRRRAEGVPQVGGGDPPRVRREIDERVDQLPAGALRHEIADEAVGIHAVGGAQIGHPEHRLARQPLRGGHHGRVGRLEGGALREGVPRIVVRHARELGAT